MDVVPDVSALAAQLEASPLTAAARFTQTGQRTNAVRSWRRRAETAARRGRRRQVARAKQMLRLGFVVSFDRSLNGLTPLHAAAACGPGGVSALDTMLAALLTLPERRRPLGIRDLHGLTPLAHAVQANWGDGIRKLAAAGADVSEAYSSKSISEFEKIPGIGASLLSFAVALGHMEAFQALLECGADASVWDRNGMRAVHIAVVCGNLVAVRDLMALDGGLGELTRKQAMELYTVREKFEKSNQYRVGRGENVENEDSDPANNHGPGASMEMELMDDDEEDADLRNMASSRWVRSSELNPNESRDFYRTLTSERDDFEIENIADSTDPDGTTEGPPADSDFTDDEDDDDEGGDGDGDGDAHLTDSSDEDTDLPDLMDDGQSDGSDDEAASKKLDEKDTAFVNALLAALNGALEPALDKFSKIQKSFDSSSESKNSASGVVNGTVAESPSARGEDDEETHFISRGAEGETHIVRVGDMVQVQHVPSENAERGDSASNQIGMFVLNAVLKALNMSRKSFYGATLLHLAVKRRHHDVLRFLLESAPYAQQIDERMNNGTAAIHIAAEDNDPVAIDLLAACGANVHCRSDTDSTTPLMRAAKKCNTAAVKKLIEKGARVAEEDDEGLSVLHFATEHRNGSEIVGILVAAGADVNAVSAEGSTPCYSAVAHGNMDVFRKLLELGGDPSIPNGDGSVPLGFIATKSMKELASFAHFVASNPVVKENMNMDVPIGGQGTTALHLAASDGPPIAVQRLLEAGSDCNKLNENGMSALVLAARREEVSPDDRLEILKHLLEAGADVKVGGEEGKQALHFVTYLGEYDSVELLLKFGADPSVPTKNKTPLHLVALENFPGIAKLLISHGADINPKDDIGMTPLMYASLRHSTRVLKVLIDAGADMSHRAEAGMTALHISGVTNHPESEETVRLLCEAGAPMDIKDDQGMFPIHLHGDFGRTRCVRRMLMAGCDPDMRCGAGFTPLIRACNSRSVISDNTTLVRVLLRWGADVNAKNHNDNTVMSYLGDTDEHALIRVMLAAGADVNIADKQGDTPLHEAAMGDHARTVALLARRGANVNARNRKLETALFIASSSGFVEVVKSLLHKSLKTDISLPNIDGMTPYQVARKNGHDKVTSLLLDSTGLRLSQFAPLTTYDIQSPRQSVDGLDGFRRHDSGRLICVTCQESLQFGESIRMLPCGHYFHDPCILPWLGGENMTNNRTCPVCKQLVAPKELFPFPPS